MPAIVNQSIIVAIGAIGYVAILMFIGVLASRRVGNNTDYIVAGRKLPLGLCVFTVFATWFGSGTLIGAAGAAYSGGLGAVLANPFGSALCLLLAGIFYARMFRRLKLLTLPDLFRTRFGRYAEILAALSIIPAYVGWVGSILVAFGTVLNVVAGFSLEAAILTGAAITIAYTCYGGMWAVSLTDFFQALVIIAGLLVLFPLILGDLGGWQALIDNSPAGHFDIAPEQSFYGWIMFMQGLLVIGLGNVASQDLLQRVFSARDERVAQWSLYLSTVLYLTIAMIPVLIGIAGTIAMPGLADPAVVLPAMGSAYLPALGMALFAGAMFSALMSSADGGMLAPASIFGNNVWRAVYPDVDESRVLHISRIAVVVVGILGLATALFFQDVYQLMVKSFSILMVSLFVPMTAAVYWKKANEAAAIAGMLGGLVCWLALEYWNLNLAQTLLPAELMAAGVNLLLLITVSKLTARQNPAKPSVDVDGRPIEMRNRIGILGFPGSAG